MNTSPDSQDFAPASIADDGPDEVSRQTVRRFAHQLAGLLMEHDPHAVIEITPDVEDNSVGLVVTLPALPGGSRLYTPRVQITIEEYEG